MKTRIKQIGYFLLGAPLLSGASVELLDLGGGTGAVAEELERRLVFAERSNQAPQWKRDHLYLSVTGLGGRARPPQTLVFGLDGRGVGGERLRDLQPTQVDVVANNRSWWQFPPLADDRLEVFPFYGGREGFHLGVVVNSSPSMWPVLEAGLAASLADTARGLGSLDGRSGSLFAPQFYGAGFAREGTVREDLDDLAVSLDVWDNRGRVTEGLAPVLEPIEWEAALNRAMARAAESSATRRGVLWVTNGFEFPGEGASPEDIEKLAGLWASAGLSRDVPLLIAPKGHRAAGDRSARVNRAALNGLAEALERRNLPARVVELEDPGMAAAVLDTMAPHLLVALTSWNRRWLPMNASEQRVFLRAESEGRILETARISVYTHNDGGWKGIFVFVGVAFLFVIFALVGLLLLYFRFRIEESPDLDLEEVMAGKGLRS